MDPVSLAALITASILPKALPYLLKLGGTMGDSFAKQAEEKFGPAAWETAKSIWSKIGDRILKKEAGKEAVEDVVTKGPEDTTAKVVLGNQIAKTLEADPELTKEVEKVIKDRIIVDMTLGDIVEESDVTGLKLKGASSAYVKLVAQNVKHSKVIGADVDTIGGSSTEKDTQKNTEKNPKTKGHP